MQRMLRVKVLQTSHMGGPLHLSAFLECTGTGWFVPYRAFMHTGLKAYAYTLCRLQLQLDAYMEQQRRRVLIHQTQRR